jgi:hypothetical protein
MASLRRLKLVDEVNYIPYQYQKKEPPMSTASQPSGTKHRICCPTCTTAGKTDIDLLKWSPPGIDDPQELQWVDGRWAWWSCAECGGRFHINNFGYSVHKLVDTNACRASTKQSYKTDPTIRKMAEQDLNEIEALFDGEGTNKPNGKTAADNRTAAEAAGHNVVQSKQPLDQSILGRLLERLEDYPQNDTERVLFAHHKCIQFILEHTSGDEIAELLEIHNLSFKLALKQLRSDDDRKPQQILLPWFESDYAIIKNIGTKD